MLARRVAALPLIVFVAGCGSEVPDGMPIAVRVERVQNAAISGTQGFHATQPLTVHNTDAEWPRVSRLLFDPLPEPVDQGDCTNGLTVTVRLSTEERVGEVDYGPCSWPKAIEPVRQLMRKILGRHEAAERRCDCPRD